MCKAVLFSALPEQLTSRTVWDGDQVPYDVRATADTIGDSSEGYPSYTLFTGRVGYTHAGGIDTPLEIIKGSALILPIADWRGQYATGTCPGTKCDPNNYYFPGAQGSAFEEPVPLPNGPPRWIGELVTGMADGSGYQYRRRRYFSPSSGGFLQEDPVGLAGGINAYTFGRADPITFSDPFGTRVCYAGGGREVLKGATERATGTRISLDGQGCISAIERDASASPALSVLANRLEELAADPETYLVALTGVGSYFNPVFPQGTVYVARVGVDQFEPNIYRVAYLGRCELFQIAMDRPARAIVHELLGHALQWHRSPAWYKSSSKAAGETIVMAPENIYLRAQGNAPRCAY